MPTDSSSSQSSQHSQPSQEGEHSQQRDPAAETADSMNVMAAVAARVDIVALDAAAVRTSVELLARATPADLKRPSPCRGWALQDLVEHSVAQHSGFAAASEGVADPSVWAARPLGADPIAAYRAAADRVLTAFALDGVLERAFPLPEFGPGVELPGPMAVAAHFIDYVVHSWDIARSLELPVEFGAEVLVPAYEIAHSIPGGELRLTPGSPFAPEVPWPADDHGLDGIVALLGRSPTWRP